MVLFYDLFISCSINRGKYFFHCEWIKGLAFEIDLREEKWVFLSIYKPPLQNCEYFLGSLHNIIDFYSGIYDNHIVLGYFNMDLSHTQLSTFIEHYNHRNLIKTMAVLKAMVYAWIWYLLLENIVLKIQVRLKLV